MEYFRSKKRHVSRTTPDCMHVWILNVQFRIHTFVTQQSVNAWQGINTVNEWDSRSCWNKLNTNCLHHVSSKIGFILYSMGWLSRLLVLVIYCFSVLRRERRMGCLSWVTLNIWKRELRCRGNCCRGWEIRVEGQKIENKLKIAQKKLNKWSISSSRKSSPLSQIKLMQY